MKMMHSIYTLSFLTHGCCEATSVIESLWLLECGVRVGQLNNGK
jgi:hypothetical protein